MNRLFGQLSATTQARNELLVAERALLIANNDLERAQTAQREAQQRISLHSKRVSMLKDFLAWESAEEGATA